MEQKKLTKRKLQALNTKENIYNKAIELITGRGFDNITVDDICREAGVAKGAFYHHFKSKDDIIIEAYNALDRYFEEEVIGELSKMDAMERLTEYMLFMAKHARDHGVEFVKQFYRSQIYTHSNYVVSESRRFYSILHEIVNYGQKDKSIRDDIDSRELSLHIMVLVRGILYDWSLHDGNYDIVEYTGRFFDIFKASIRYRE